MKFLSAKKKENAHAQPTASSSKQPQRPRTPNPVPVKHDHFLAPPRRALEPLSLTPDRNATVRSKKSRKDPSPSRGPYPFSRAFFSQSTPSIARVTALDEPLAPPVPVIPGRLRPQPLQQHSSPSFFSALKHRRQRADSSNAEATTSKTDLLDVPTLAPRARTRSFGAYLMGVSGSGSGKRRDRSPVPSQLHAPELPPLPPVSALQLFDDGGRLHRAHPSTPATPRKKRSPRTPSRPSAPPPIDHYPHRPQTQRSCSEPVALTPRKNYHPLHDRTPSKSTSPVPVLDGVWQGFLAEVEEDVSVLDLHGALKASLELDWPSTSSPSSRFCNTKPLRPKAPGTPTRSTSASVLPYLTRTPNEPETTRPSPAKRHATDSELDIDALLTRTASNFSLSLFPLPPTSPPPLMPVPSPGDFIPSRPAPRPPRLALPSHYERERNTTPRKLSTPPPFNPAPTPRKSSSSSRRPPTADSDTSVSSQSHWDELFDVDDSHRDGRCSSRATSVSHNTHHTRGSTSDRSHRRERSGEHRPTTCEFFSTGTEVKWGYAV